MRTRRLSFLLLSVLAALSMASEQTFAGIIEWRVSVKFILNSSDQRPLNGNLNTDQEVLDQIDLANEILATNGRGFRLRLTETVDVSGVDEWFDADVCDEKAALEVAAEADPGTYVWRTSAINVYINGNAGAGCCSFPATGDIILLGQGARATTVLHEIGHFMNLCHTQGCPCGSCGDGDGECNTTPGDDGLNDTLPDLACWDRDDIAQWTYGMDYGDLDPGEQSAVDFTFFNIMSYHNTRNRMTDDQLDLATDSSNGVRNNVATGEAVFVDVTAGGGGTGSSTDPFATVAEGVAEAGNGDIVLLRSGVYAESITIFDPTCLRSTRGAALIGLGAAGLNALPALQQPPERTYPDTDDGRTGP